MSAEQSSRTRVSFQDVWEYESIVFVRALNTTWTPRTILWEVPVALAAAAAAYSKTPSVFGAAQAFFGTMLVLAGAVFVSRRSAVRAEMHKAQALRISELTGEAARAAETA